MFHPRTISPAVVGAFLAILLPAVMLLGGPDDIRNLQQDSRFSARPLQGGANLLRPRAICVIKAAVAAATQPSQGNVKGTLTLVSVDGGIRVTGDLEGLPPSSKHGFHFHAKGDLSAPDLSSAGGHFDPGGHHKHGGPDDAEHHAGDLGNIQSDAAGKAHVDVVAKGVSLQGESGIVGKSIIIHANEDDLKGQPAGNAGPRIAGGLIELATDLGK